MDPRGQPKFTNSRIHQFTNCLVLASALAAGTVPLALTRADASRVVATGAAPIGALPPGDYVVRGVIQLEDGARGRVSRTLRNVAR